MGGFVTMPESDLKQSFSSLTTFVTQSQLNNPFMQSTQVKPLGTLDVKKLVEIWVTRTDQRKVISLVHLSILWEISVMRWLEKWRKLDFELKQIITKLQQVANVKSISVLVD